MKKTKFNKNLISFNLTDINIIKDRKLEENIDINKGKDFPTVPDALYRCKIKRVNYNPETNKVSIPFVIMRGDFHGETIWLNYNLNNDYGLKDFLDALMHLQTMVEVKSMTWTPGTIQFVLIAIEQEKEDFQFEIEQITTQKGFKKYKIKERIQIEQIK